jgi:hypothetical protein
MMGWLASPYLTIQSHLLADEVVQGSRKEPGNAYHWDSVTLNLLGSSSYTPQLPWVRRIRRDGDIASDSPTYVDDIRALAVALPACWTLGHHFASWMTYLGLQVAARKTRAPSQAPGAWAGVVAFAGQEGIGVSCLQESG